MGKILTGEFRELGRKLFMKIMQTLFILSKIAELLRLLYLYQGGIGGECPGR